MAKGGDEETAEVSWAETQWERQSASFGSSCCGDGNRLETRTRVRRYRILLRDLTRG
jgi:hypothetical protein